MHSYLFISYSCSITTVKIITNVIIILFLQSGRTPLHEAASCRWNAQVLEVLLKAGADGNAVDKVSSFQHHSVSTDK